MISDLWEYTCNLPNGLVRETLKFYYILITRLQKYSIDIERTLSKAIETGIILWIVDIKKTFLKRFSELKRKEYQMY